MSVGELSQQQKQKVGAHIAANQARCPICSNSRLQLGDRIALLPYGDVNGNTEIGNGYPVILAVCQNCFHVIYFAAMPLLGVNDSGSEG